MSIIRTKRFSSEGENGTGETSSAFRFVAYILPPESNRQERLQKDVERRLGVIRISLVDEMRNAYECTCGSAYDAEEFTKQRWVSSWHFVDSLKVLGNEYFWRSQGASTNEDVSRMKMRAMTQARKRAEERSKFEDGKKPLPEGPLKREGVYEEYEKLVGGTSDKGCINYGKYPVV